MLALSQSRPMRGNGIHQQEMRKTVDDFGKGINPHLFCSILAKPLGRSDVAKWFSAHSVLANTPRVSANSHDDSTPTAAACLPVAMLTDESCRKAYIGSIIDKVEVANGCVRIYGRNDVLEQAVISGGGAVLRVRSSVRGWRA